MSYFHFSKIKSPIQYKDSLKVYRNSLNAFKTYQTFSFLYNQRSKQNSILMKTNSKKYTFFILLVLGMMSISYAQQRGGQRPERGQRPEPPSFEELLEKMDANDDGKLAKDEVAGPLARDFKQIDSNEDGFITEEELSKGKPDRKRRRPQNKDGITLTTVFKDMDSDKDKKIAKTEAKDVIAKRFDEFDLDSDGYISKVEMSKALKKINNNN